MENQIRINKNDLERLIRLNFTLGYNLAKNCRATLKKEWMEHKVELESLQRSNQFKESKDSAVRMFIRGLNTLTEGNLELHNN